MRCVLHEDEVPDLEPAVGGGGGERAEVVVDFGAGAAGAAAGAHGPKVVVGAEVGDLGGGEGGDARPEIIGFSVAVENTKKGVRI